MSSVLGNKHNAFQRFGAIILTCFSFQHKHIYYIAHVVQVEQGRAKLTEVDQVTKFAQL